MYCMISKRKQLELNYMSKSKIKNLAKWSIIICGPVTVILTTVDVNIDLVIVDAKTVPC